MPSLLCSESGILPDSLPERTSRAGISAVPSLQEIAAIEALQAMNPERTPIEGSRPSTRRSAELLDRASELTAGQDATPDGLIASSEQQKLKGTNILPYADKPVCIILSVMSISFLTIVSHFHGVNGIGLMLLLIS